MNGDPERIDELLQFLEQAAGIGLLGGIGKRTHQERALHRLVPGFDFKHQPYTTCQSAKCTMRPSPIIANSLREPDND